MASRNVAVRPLHDKDDQQKTMNVQNKDKPSVKAKACDFFEQHSSVVILLLSVMAVAFDPFFFFIPVVKNASTCLGFDHNLRIVIVILRSLVDVLHTILWWHYSWPFFRQRYEKSRNHLITIRTVAIVAILPLPQVVILVVSWQLLTVKMLKLIVLIQFFIRLYRIIPTYKEATRSSEMLPTYTWFAAAIYFIMYTIASNVFGAFWYLRAVERNMDCWKGACDKNRTLCVGSSLYCDHTSSYNGFLHKHCSKSLDYGIYKEAFQTIITEKDIHFLDKFFQCFWWGLRNMSSYGQNLETGTYIWDNFFAVVIGSCGLIIFAFFIGNMQTYLQTRTPDKLENMKLRRRHLKEWNPINVLPENLKREVKLCEDPRWQQITEVDLESLLHNIPTELSEEVKFRLCEDMFKRVPEFAILNDVLWKELCNRATPVVYPARSYILRERDLITEIILILNGDLFSYIGRGNQPSSSYTECDRNEVDLQLHRFSKDNYLFYGHELIRHWLPSQAAPILPIAQRTIKALTKVEAFVISAIDLNCVYDKLSSPENLYGLRGIIRIDKRDEEADGRKQGALEPKST